MGEFDRRKILNELLNGELRAAHLYWQAAAWCAERHLEGCAEFLLTHADEELSHMRKMLTFILDNEMHVEFEELPAPKVDAETLLDLFKLILGHEGKVTDAIGRAVSRAQDAGDHGTFEFLQWFVMEQREEMKLFRHIVDRITLIGDGPHALFFADQEVTNIAAKTAAGATPGPTAA